MPISFVMGPDRLCLIPLCLLNNYNVFISCSKLPLIAVSEFLETKVNFFLVWFLSLENFRNVLASEYPHLGKSAFLLSAAYGFFKLYQFRFCFVWTI